MPSRVVRPERAVVAVPGRRPAFIARGALSGGAVAVYAVVLLSAGLHQQDVGAYLQGAHDLLDGRHLYTTFLQHPFPDPTLRPAFIYPPVFALLMAPLALLPGPVAIGLWSALNQAALLAAIVLAARWLQPSAWSLAALVAATATFYPLWIDVVQGQANLLVLLLFVIGLVGTLGNHDRLAAAWGLAAALKVSPALLLLWLLVERRWRAAGWMVAGFAALTTVGMALRFDDTITFFTRVLPGLAGGTAMYANQSIDGFILRVATVNPYTDPWLRLHSALLLVACLSLSLLGWWAWRTRHAESSHRLLAFLPLIPLLSSVTWPHHLVLLLPVIWAIFTALGRRQWPALPTAAAVGTLLVFDVLPRLPVGPAFGQSAFRASQTADPLVIITANAFLLGTGLLFFSSPWLLRSR